MRMRIYHNYENNQLEAYVLADEGRALSGQKKNIRESLPECVAELHRLVIERSAATVATINVDGYGSIVVCCPERMKSDVRLHAGSRERLCNRKLARNKDVEVPTSDDLASALATVLRSESACRRANDLDTAVRFDYPAESADRVLVAVGEGDGWGEPEPESVETVEVEPVEIEHDGVIDVEMAETAEIPAVKADTAATDTAVSETAAVECVQADTASPTETTTDETAPRAVVSSPALPAECSAETVEIPEVPPQVNADARVLAVSEHVIPTGESVTDAFGVAYRAVHYVRRVVERRDGTTTKKKVAAVFRLGDTVHVVRRDRYENAGRDAAVEAEIAAHVERLQRAA